MSPPKSPSPDLTKNDDDLDRTSRSKRFRFKEKEDRPHRNQHGEHNDDGRRRRRHHHEGHRSKRRKESTHLADDPSAYDDSASNLPPDTAFRESLFDALGDDEGAAFWEGVYGQPIHNYSNTYQGAETGTLERMNDDEYAQFVRRKMWEKSWEGIEAARKQRQEAQKRSKEKTKPTPRQSEPRQENHNFIFDLEIENSLRRGEHRKDRKRWKGLWEDYVRIWAELQSISDARRSATTDTEQLYLRNKIAWPVESGKHQDVTHENVEHFIRKCISAVEQFEGRTGLLVSSLKIERIRWHPDKVQQRFGFMHIDSKTMESVTAVFQVIDRMWTEIRP